LDKYTYLKDILLSDNFFKKLWFLVSSDILWTKRHRWKIDFVETRKAREIIIWNFKDKECLMYKLIETQNINL
jgi:Uri superfamily endonuclease